MSYNYNDLGEAIVCARCDKKVDGCKCVGIGGESGPFHKKCDCKFPNHKKPECHECKHETS